MSFPPRTHRLRRIIAAFGASALIAALTPGLTLVLTGSIARASTPVMPVMQAFRSASQPRVSAGTDTYLVEPGDAAHIPVAVSTADGQDTTSTATVAWSLGGGTAISGTDYPAASGILQFPAGTASGTSQSIDVSTVGATPAAPAKTIVVTLTPTGATGVETTPLVVIDAHGLPYLNPALTTEQRLTDLMSRMSLADKVGQMTQAERTAIGNGTDLSTYRLGSLLTGGGTSPNPNTPAAEADMIDHYQTQTLATPLQIPLIYGIDSVHGDNNLERATIFPHNIAMGATRDPTLVEQEGVVAATETRATGIPWVFTPCVCVTRDERWGRAYESYGEDPALVDLMTIVVKGLQNNGKLAANTSVLATAKHFLGDGGTRYGSSAHTTYTLDQGKTYVTQKQLDALFVKPFATAVRDGVGSVMPSYSSLQILGRDRVPVKMHARGDMITGLLKQKLGFKGFVISDYAAISQISPDYKNAVKLGINAGLDMIMVPTDYKTFIADLTDLVHSGDVKMSRINDAVRRILTQKFALDLLDHPFADRSNLTAIGSVAHRAVARRAVAESQVLLKNAHSILPLNKTAKVYVAGSNAADEGNQSGGWTLTWQGQSGSIPGATSILQGMKQVAPHARIAYSKDASASMSGYHLGVVVVGETPYAEGVGDVGNDGRTLQIDSADRRAIAKVCAAMRCVVLDVSGRPQDLMAVVGKAAGIVASWLPGSEGEGVGDVLFGNKAFTGRLPETWAKASSQLPINVGDRTYDPLYPYGWGVRTDNPRKRLLALRASLTKQAGTRNVVTVLGRALAHAGWTSTGTLAQPDRVMAELAVAGTLMTGSARFTFHDRDIVVSVARDAAQRAIVWFGSAAMRAAAATTAHAENTLLTGHAGYAVTLLRRARSKARTFVHGEVARGALTGNAN